MKKIFAACAIASLVAGCSISYSDGYRVGHLQKYTNKGFVFKVYEGELATDGIKSSAIDRRMSSTWEFNVLSEEVNKQLATIGEKKVKLYYKEWIIKNPFTMTTPYEVTKIEVLN